VSLGCLALFRRDPVTFDDTDWMVAPECALLGIDGNDWEGDLLRVGFDHHVLVEHGCRKILRSIGEHLAPEKSRRAAVMHDRLLDAREEFGDLRSADIGYSEIGLLA